MVAVEAPAEPVIPPGEAAAVALTVLKVTADKLPTGMSGPDNAPLTPAALLSAVPFGPRLAVEPAVEPMPLAVPSMPEVALLRLPAVAEDAPAAMPVAPRTMPPPLLAGPTPPPPPARGPLPPAPPPAPIMSSVPVDAAT